jgi:thioredoxin 1
MEKLILEKYGHDYCNPCRLLAPILKEIEDKYQDTIQVVEYNTHETDPAKLQAAKITAVPTLILIKENEEIWRQVGLLMKDQLFAKLDEFTK